MTEPPSETLAITGATGFVGGHLLSRAVERGFRVRALTRRPQPEMPGITWIEGAIDPARGLQSLVDGAGAVIHVAGIINAATPRAFDACNVDGTAAMIAAARGAGIDRFIHVSSLAAREPGLSAYGRSKALSEALLPQSGLDWTIVRPPAVYGPGDRESFELFRMAARGLILLPPGGRLSVIHARDLCDLLLRLAETGAASGLTLEPDDGRPAGWDHREFAAAIAEAVGRPARALPMPAILLKLGAAVDTGWARLNGRLPKLSFDRARYFSHPDWVAAPARKPTPAIWSPAVETRTGLAATAAWYRGEGWL